MQDAFNLGFKLALVVNGDARPELLDSYEAERRPIAEQVIWAASSLHEIFMGHGKDIAERAKKISDHEFLDAVVGRCSGISYTYRDYVDQSDDRSEPGSLMVGDRVPDLDLANGQTLFDLTRHPGFTLLGVPGPATDIGSLSSAIGQLRSRASRLLRGDVIAVDANAARILGAGSEDQICLVRPDGYLGFRCPLSQVDKLNTYLGQILTLN
jgi:hypothetical protein